MGVNFILLKLGRPETAQQKDSSGLEGAQQKLKFKHGMGGTPVI